MNTWGDIKKLAIVEADDFQDKYTRNGLEVLFYWKSKYPKFKISLFTIPNKTSREFLNLIERHSDWIEILVHGWDHDSNYECWEWDYEKTRALMYRLIPKFLINEGVPLTLEEVKPHSIVPVSNIKEIAVKSSFYRLVFKAPGWMITGNEKGEGSGYPLQPHNKLASDNQAVYKALRDLNFIVFDRHYNKQFRPEGLKCVCVDCNPDIVHMHTWDMPTGDLAGKNGFRQVEELHGVPWDLNTEFKFVSEAWEEGLFKPCI